MQANHFQWKIGGEAGFGIMTTGQIFSKVCNKAGLKTFAYPEYPSLIRGGHNTYQVFVDGDQATSHIHDVHILVCLNKETLDLHTKELVDDSVVIYDPADFKKVEGGKPEELPGKKILFVPIEMNALCKEHGVDRVARNTIGIGASFGLLGAPWEIVEESIREWFEGKKPEIIEGNVTLAKAGYDLGFAQSEHFPYHITPQEHEPQMVISGNAALAMGAIKAGMKFFAAYPMTPSSDILSYMAEKELEYDLVVKHTEDEIAAMNMIIGAGFAGVRAMTSTSGGGFALMTEALGMAGIAEVPLVAIMGQRPGPSTGLPTWTSQSDLRFVLHASQAEFPRIVLTPGDPEECFYLAHEAFNLAEKYQTPVIILVDKYNQQSWQSVPVFKTDHLRIERGKLLTQDELNAIAATEEGYKRHEHTDDGISRRALPGMDGGRHIASSYEHNEYGHTTEDADETTRQNDKRFRKMHTFVANDAKAPEFYGPEHADVTIVGWGSTKLTALETIRMAAQQGLSVNYLHFVYIDPLPVNAVIEQLNKTRKTLMVEGNKLGQLAGWIREHTGFTMDAQYHLYNGRPFAPEDVLARVQDLMNE